MWYPSHALWALGSCAFFSGGSAFKTQQDFLQHEPASLPSKSSERLSEKTFRFSQSPQYMSDLKSSTILPPRNVQSNHAEQLSKFKRKSKSEVVDSTVHLGSQPLSISFHIQGKLASIEYVIQIVGLMLLVFLLACMMSCILQFSDHHKEDYETVDIAGAAYTTWSARAESQAAGASPSEDFLQAVGRLPQSPSAEGGSQAVGRPLHSPSAQGGSCPSPRTKESLAESIEDEENQGTWACTFRRVQGQQKVALELVFRCGVVPRQEFARSRISQEHIDECIWIAMHMLRQRPLEEWVALWREAQETFEHNVTACVAARTDVLDGTPQNSDCGAPILDCQVQGSTEPPSAKCRALLRVGPRSLPAAIAEDDVLQKRDSNGEHMLTMRCREILAASRAQESTVGESAIPTQNMPPNVESVIGEKPSRHLQSQPLDITMSWAPTSAPRVQLKAFEEVVPAAVVAVDTAARPNTWPEIDIQCQDGGSSAACSTSTFPNRDPTPACRSPSWEPHGRCREPPPLPHRWPSVETQPADTVTLSDLRS